MDKKFSVVIGRFQPPHEAHFKLFEEALKNSDRLLILIGSADIPRSIKNPFTQFERIKMIDTEMETRDIVDGGDRADRISYRGVPDSFYSDTVWIAQVQSIVMAATHGSNDITLFGHDKDASSYYLKMFPQWKFHNVDSLENGLSATDIRNALFEGDETEVLDNTPVKLRWFRDKPEFSNLVEEYNYLKEYKNSWASSPYPPTFVTADSVVLRSGHILMVQRNENPGKGNWALPGGFVEQHETLEACAIRELHEETGLAILPEILKDSITGVKVFDYPDRSLRGRVITHAHFFNLGMGDLPRVLGASDASTAEWKPLNWVFSNGQQIHEDHLSIITSFVTKHL